MSKKDEWLSELRQRITEASPEEVKELLGNGNEVVVVDVRDSTEFRSGHVVGAVNIPHASIVERLAELTRYRDKPVVVMCKMGQHAGSAGIQLRKAGFTNVTKLRGGVSEWRGQNLPLVKG